MLSATMRDIAIIIVAIQSIVISVLIAVLIWQIYRLLTVIQSDLKPIIDDTQVTVNTVRGTTEFVSNNVVDPVIRSSATVAKWRTTAALLLGGLGLGRKPPPSSPTPPPAPPPASPPVPSPSQEVV